MSYIEHDFPIEDLNRITQKEGNAKKPIYQMHKWWARRLGSVFRMLILTAFAPDDLERGELWRRFYSRNDLQVSGPDGTPRPPIILDPFMGGGTTVVEALRLGCKVVGVDLNPVAWFVTKKEIEPVDLEALERAFEQLEKTVAPKILRYYRTTCPMGHGADVMYVFWVKKVTCVGCGREVQLFPSFRLASKEKKKEHTVFCPDCIHIFTVDSLSRETNCPECGRRFVPERGTTHGGKYTCPHCGQVEPVLGAVRRGAGPPEADMFALEYYCAACEQAAKAWRGPSSSPLAGGTEGGNPYAYRGYKRAGERDWALFEEAKAEFARRKDELALPDQLIPMDIHTDAVIFQNYHYFHQLFNERQLLCLGMLLEEIARFGDENIRELMLLTFSSIVETNNSLCRYNELRQTTEGIFSRHALWPTSTFGEGNIWGAQYGRGTLRSHYRKVRRGKEYAIRPIERDGPIHRSTGDTVQAVLSPEFTALSHDDTNTLLRAQTAEDMAFLPDCSIDAVITDPPYCGNVSYSELADFFYVWLRLGLADRYPHFRPEYTPKSREIISNVGVRGSLKKMQELGIEIKDEESFFRGLTRVFRECRRVLKDEGLMVFTFHHKETWAWKSVLNAILEAGFYVVAVYPVHAEMKTSTHIMGGGLSYDIPFVCRKRPGGGQPVGWETLKDEIYFAAQESVERLKTSDRGLSDGDLFVIVMGRCLEIYSKHWPHVLKEGQPVDVEQAVDDLDDLVDSLIKSYELKLLPPTLDELTKRYLLYVAGQATISADELRKRLVTGGGSLDDFTARGYLVRQGQRLAVAAPGQRSEFIAHQIERGAELPLIDVAHYLYAVYQSGQPLQWTMLGRWGRDELVAVLEHLYRKTGDRAWRSVAELSRRALAPRPERLV